MRLEKVYGDRLSESLNTEYNLLTNLEVLENLIKELKGEVLTCDGLQEIAEEQSEKLKEYLNRMDIKLDMVIENVEDIFDSREF